MELLFSKGELDAALRSTVEKLLDDVDRWDADQLLAQSENEIAAHLADKHSAHCPVLQRDDIYASEPVDVKQAVRDFDRAIEVPATRVTVHVPYVGERILFFLRPNSFTLNPPRADVTEDEVVLTFEERQLDGDRVRQQMQQELGQIEHWLANVRSMTDAHNASVLETALSAIQRRTQKLLSDRATVAGLGIPVRRRGDAPSYALPVERRRPMISRPPTPVSTKYEPEPTLSATDYDEAVRIIMNSGRQLERSPSTTARLDEEERRDLLLVALNSQFEGQAGAEVFNGAGKTDILLRIENRNVFIAECKIWRGPKAFAGAIDQLLGYLVWRDTKAALVLFIQTKNPTQAIEKAAAAIADHPRCLQAIRSRASDERQDFVLLAEADPAREIRLALLPVVITVPEVTPDSNN
jgi:hypothetical protein